MVFPKFSRVRGPVLIFKKFGRAQFLSDSLESFFKQKLCVSSLQENQVWGCRSIWSTRKTPTDFFQPIISDPCTQLPGARELGSTVGSFEGLSLGCVVGLPVGACVGISVGRSVG